MKSFLSLVHSFDKVKQLSFCEGQTLDDTDHLLVLVEILGTPSRDGIGYLIHPCSEILLKHLEQRLFGQCLFSPSITLPIVFCKRPAHISDELGFLQYQLLFRLKAAPITLRDCLPNIRDELGFF
jgi:hypothetical protein